MPRLMLAVTVLIAFTLGIASANKLLDNLAITLNTEREFMVNQVSQSLKPQTKSTIALQNTIYQQRIDSLQNRIKQVETKNQSINQYIAPMEEELSVYRETFNEKAKANTEERLQLYVDIVSKYRDYHRAMTSLESFIPLHKSDSLLSLPSIQLDLISNAGGSLALTHNRFIDETRDASFAAHYEPQLRRFLHEQQLNVALVECHATLCAVHLGNVWQDPYYQGFNKLWDALSAQPWMNLTRVGQSHQYRGKGHQIEVWYLEATQ